MFIRLRLNRHSLFDGLDVSSLGANVGLTNTGDTLLVDLDGDASTDMAVIIDGLDSYVTNGGIITDLLLV